jgi:hypothetical protein
MGGPDQLAGWGPGAVLYVLEWHIGARRGTFCASSGGRRRDPRSAPDCCLRASDRAHWEWLGGGSLHQFAVAAAAGLMWANMLRPFQVGKARTSHEGPWSWIRESRVASPQESWPACHFTNASASAVM